MSSAPYGVRLLVGVAVTAVDETKKLPQTILMAPMTLASQLAQLVMKLQQDLADFVIRGDATLEALFPPTDEQAEWAVFDEDDSPASAPAEPAEPRTEGRFALYSVSGEDAAAAARAERSATAAPADRTAPPVAVEIDYDELTLAQLRSRLQSLSVDELEQLLNYEEAGKARAPFQTLLANRITRASAK
ncbi:lipid droplet-associated protein [Mycolicibacterium brumae]|uniref:Lipid droplet-associated protein n=1 Tax=Mycolicibacterium brumae TaxID=85968 RepID=A0A2G5PEN6_9MYCO|nr:lipid droplet-associated protein [Mycolicibacterium brumae]MCV7192018.1 lipid droplet-associated protein [Mycolicibacterium brumae]PIB76778.1 hypothetical protein CQY22_003775 [Mycolicibacterium brumae]UWW07784.1 lipid droplet-associated protein [Mycolicibacterium brumae]